MKKTFGVEALRFLQRSGNVILLSAKLRAFQNINWGRMVMKIVGILLGLVIFILNNGVATGADLAVSEATGECIDCHTSVHPGIVQDWLNSRHAKIST